MLPGIHCLGNLILINRNYYFVRVRLIDKQRKAIGEGHPNDTGKRYFAGNNILAHNHVAPLGFKQRLAHATTGRYGAISIRRTNIASIGIDVVISAI